MSDEGEDVPFAPVESMNEKPKREVNDSPWGIPRCYKMPVNPFEQKPPPAPMWGKEQVYNNRVLNGNWFEERRMYHQLCSRCTGHSIYRTEFLPYCKEDYIQDGCVPPKNYEALSTAEGEGWKLLRNTEDYCQYLSNYTTTYDLMHNWEVRRANCKAKPRRKWKPIRDNLWLPERDNALSYGNLTQYGFRQSPALPPVPNDWKTYDMSTEYTNRFAPHKFPESYTLCRYAAPKYVHRELEEYAMTDDPQTTRPGICDLKCGDPNANNADCPCAYSQNPPRFSNKCHTSKLIPHPGKQTLYASRKDPYMALKHPPHTLPYDSKPILNAPHSCENRELCAIGQYAQDVAKCSS